MTSRKNSTKQHTLRKSLLSEGFRPLPALSKGVRIKGWSTVEIDDKFLDRYARAGKYQNTGLRCDDLIAFDIDVYDEDLADDVEALIEDKCGPTELCRVGKWPKRLLLYRSDGAADKSARTGQYGGHMVEMLATHGRQFIAFGKHPSGNDYEWLGVSPLMVSRDSLPGVSPELALQVLDECNELLEATGLERTGRPGRRGVSAPANYDLEPDTPILLEDGHETTWGELRETLTTTGLMGNLIREDGEFGDSNGVHFYMAEGSNEAVAYDFARDAMHYEVPAGAELAEALPPKPEGDTAQLGADPLLEFMAGWVLLNDNNCRRIDAPMRDYKVAGIKQRYQYKTVLVERKGKMVPVPVVELWLKNPGTLRADYAAMRPDHAGELIIENGPESIFNTFRPPVHADKGGEVDTFLEFVDHLVPDEWEADLLLDWVAYKYVHPGARLHGLLTVTKTQGTGRGTLAAILADLMGADYVRRLELHDLIGTVGQAQFNAHLADSTLLYIPEALEEDEKRTTWQSRHLAYERIKQIIDPLADRVEIKRKYGANSTERTFASVLISSNHINAMAIEEGDRRLIVLTNTDTPLVNAPDRLHDRITDWRARPDNIAALARYLVDRVAEGLEYQPHAHAPMTPAKALMVEHSRSDIDHAFELFVDQAAGDICCAYQVKAFMQHARIEHGLDDIPTDSTRLDQAVNAVLQKNAERFVLMGKTGRNANQLSMDGARPRAWVIRNFNRYKGNADVAAVKEQLRRNGAVSATVVKHPSAPK